MTCPSCTRAAQDPRTGLYHSDCGECGARALAHGQTYSESREAGRILPEYRDLLKSVFGAEAWEAGHQRVKAWHKRITGVAA